MFVLVLANIRVNAKYDFSKTLIISLNTQIVMEVPVSERIKFLVASREKGNKSAFGRTIGVTPQAVADILETKGGPSFPVLQKILKAYPDLNSEWLILGVGEMLKGQQSETTGCDEHAALQVETGALLNLAVAEAKIEEKDKQLADREKQLADKEKQLEAKDKLIDRLLTLNGIPEKLGKLMSSSPAALARLIARLSQQGQVAEMALS